MTSGKNSRRGSGKPRKFALLQNIPNPFSDFTEIRFHLPQKCLVKLQVLDRNDRLIRDLVVREIDPGDYTVIWNGKSNDDRTIPEGIYILKMQAEDFEQKRKMVLIR